MQAPLANIEQLLYGRAAELPISEKLLAAVAAATGLHAAACELVI